MRVEPGSRRRARIAVGPLPTHPGVATTSCDERWGLGVLVRRLEDDAPVRHGHELLLFHFSSSRGPHGATRRLHGRVDHRGDRKSRLLRREERLQHAATSPAPVRRVARDRLLLDRPAMPAAPCLGALRLAIDELDEDDLLDRRRAVHGSERVANVIEEEPVVEVRFVRTTLYDEKRPIRRPTDLVVTRINRGPGQRGLERPRDRDALRFGRSGAKVSFVRIRVTLPFGGIGSIKSKRVRCTHRAAFERVRSPTHVSPSGEATNSPFGGRGREGAKARVLTCGEEQAGSIRAWARGLSTIPAKQSAEALFGSSFGAS